MNWDLRAIINKDYGRIEDLNPEYKCRAAVSLCDIGDGIQIL